MTVHIPHDDILEAGLNDECIRCADLAYHPDQLDEANLARLRAGHLYTELDRRAAAFLSTWQRGGAI